MKIFLDPRFHTFLNNGFTAGEAKDRFGTSWMLIFEKQALVFLATPKTASTAIEQALGSLATVRLTRPPEIKHTDAAQFATYLRPYLLATTGHSYATLALMREPRDWLGSWYRNPHREDEAQETSTLQVDFEEFVRLACGPNPPEFARVGTQSGFLCPNGSARVDHIFRYDRLVDFVHFLESRLDFEIVLPRLNVSPKGDLHLSAAAEELISHTFAADFALYRSLPTES